MAPKCQTVVHDQSHLYCPASFAFQAQLVAEGEQKIWTTKKSDHLVSYHSIIVISPWNLIKHGPAWWLACQTWRLIWSVSVERLCTECPHFIFLIRVAAAGWEAGMEDPAASDGANVGREQNVTDTSRKCCQWGFRQCLQEAKRLWETIYALYLLWPLDYFPLYQHSIIIFFTFWVLCYSPWIILYPTFQMNVLYCFNVSIIIPALSLYL